MDKLNEQEIVINTCNKNVIVSASAGSGKTSTMIRKILKTIIDNKCDLSRFLILTYTNAAAGEMKSRLISLLIDKLDNFKEKQFLINQIENISISDISTFHSFYEKVVRANYYFLNINPNFSVLEQEEDTKLKNKAFINATNYFKTNRAQDYENIYSLYSKKRKDNSLKTIVLKLDEFLAAQDDEEKWLNKNALELYTNFDSTTNVWNEYILSNLKFVYKKFSSLLEKSVKLSQDKISAHLNSCLSEIETLMQLDFETRFNIITSGFSFPRQPVFKNLNEDLVSQVKLVKKSFQQFISKIKNENGCCFNSVKENNEKALLGATLVIDFYKQYQVELLQLKNNQNAYNFNDLERFCFKLLHVKSLRENLQNKYDFIFVDEFQDVNPLQQKIVNMLAKNNNLFIVGDPKQSIYAFRQSDVELFNKQEKQFANEAESETLILKNNYRSNKDILNFCNIVFSNLITEKTVGIDYEKTSKFSPMAEIPTNFAPVNIELIQQDENVEFEFNAEAALIVSKISEIIEDKIYDKELKDFRKVKFSDIAILVRSRDELAYDIASLCEKSGIPYIMDAEIDIKKSKLALKIMALLKVVYGYYNDIDLATTLNTFFDFDMLQLTEIKNCSEEQSLLSALQTYSNEDNISEKIAEFNLMLESLKLEMSTIGAYLALSNFFEKVGFYDYINATTHKNFYKKDFDVFMAYIKDNYNYNLLGLLNMFEENESIKLESTNETQLDLVKITTIHASKGLEYPIVFLVGMSNDIFKHRNSNEILINKNLGIALAEEQSEHFGSYTFYQSAIKFNERNLELAESLRLLYVAMTRPKNHLFIFGDYQFVEKFNEEEIKFVDSTYMNYILGSLNDDAIKAINEQTNFMASEFKIEIVNANELSGDAQLNKMSEEELSEEEKAFILEKTKSFNNFIYANIQNVNTAQKTSVTEMSNDLQYESVSYVPKSFNISEHLETNENKIEMGNFLHEILKNCELNFNDAQIEAVALQVYEDYKEEITKIEISKIVNIIKLALKQIKGIVSGNVEIYKEKEFILSASPKELLGYDSNEKILVQGKIDFFAIGDKTILIDYKYSDINNSNLLLNKYTNQLKIYEFAIKEAFNKNVDEIYLLNIKNNNLIKLK